MQNDLLELAKRLDARIRFVHRNRNQLKAELASLILHMDEKGLHRHLGFASVIAYASQALGWSPGHTRDVLAMARRLVALPKLRAKFESGAATWTSVRAAASVATPEDEDVWVERVDTWTVRDLERAAKAKQGKPLTLTWKLELTEEQAAIVEQAVRELRKEHEGISREAAIVELCRRGLNAGVVGSSKTRIVYHVAEDGATIETASGAVPVAPETIRAAASAEVLDLREAEPTLTRHIPAAVERKILARTNGRCAVLDCPNLGWIEIHHTGGWRNTGHDPDQMAPLCTAHHADDHGGRISVSWDGAVYRTLLADGTEVRPRSRERSSEVDDAVKALVNLELRPSEARAAVEVAIERCGRGASVEDLVRAALSAVG